MRVVIADDSILVRNGLRRLLDGTHLDVVGEAADAPELLALVESATPDVAIVDIRMPPSYRLEGIEAADAIRERHPAVGVLVLSQYVEAEYVTRLLEHGENGRGYLLKDRVASTGEIVEAAERVARGEVVVDRELVARLLAEDSARGTLDTLTPREREILALMAEGLTDRGIAERLWLTRKTVETHVRHILRKLELPAGAANNRRVQAVLTYLSMETRRAPGRPTTFR